LRVTHVTYLLSTSDVRYSLQRREGEELSGSFDI
jgi:hypothetical protein